jgi:hypothetical protein
MVYMIFLGVTEEVQGISIIIFRPIRNREHEAEVVYCTRSTGIGRCVFLVSLFRKMLLFAWWQYEFSDNDWNIVNIRVEPASRDPNQVPSQVRPVCTR